MHTYYITIELHENKCTWNFKEIVPSKKENAFCFCSFFHHFSDTQAQ